MMDMEEAIACGRGVPVPRMKTRGRDAPPTVPVDVNDVTGQFPNEYVHDFDVVRYDRAGKETRRWTLHGAWIKVLGYDDLEGSNTGEVLREADRLLSVLEFRMKVPLGRQPRALTSSSGMTPNPVPG